MASALVEPLGRMPPYSSPVLNWAATSSAPSDSAGLGQHDGGVHHERVDLPRLEGGEPGRQVLEHLGLLLRLQRTSAR